MNKMYLHLRRHLVFRIWWLVHPLKVHSWNKKNTIHIFCKDRNKRYYHYSILTRKFEYHNWSFHSNEQTVLLNHMDVKMIYKDEQCQPRSRKKIIQVNCFFPLNWASTYDVSMSFCPSVKNKEKLVELPKVKSRFEGKPK